MDTITTIATVPAVIALVTIAKNLGLPTKLSPVLAVTLGIALSVFDAMAVSQDITNWYEPVGLGLILGLSASGLYDGAKAVGGSKANEYVVEKEIGNFVLEMDGPDGEEEIENYFEDNGEPSDEPDLPSAEEEVK